ncbi:hypothetical protein PKOR_15725 [Pontibacter korlensis]|uniref:Uncharacterized protein n=1 Tax=Pontibacter korlensis TaxID=400092 RepID=A0A0E3ZHX2_9BACT|nr:hypothetical protein PKOR_15725 [Pontibacter korlensis]
MHGGTEQYPQQQGDETYFERKVSEGKSNMSILNAVRNKLLHQAVTALKRGTPYEVRLNIT